MVLQVRNPLRSTQSQQKRALVTHQLVGLVIIRFIIYDSTHPFSHMSHYCDVCFDTIFSCYILFYWSCIYLLQRYRPVIRPEKGNSVGINRTYGNSRCPVKRTIGVCVVCYKQYKRPDECILHHTSLHGRHHVKLVIGDGP